MEILLIIFYLAAFGFAAAIGAKQKKRNAPGWFFLGILFNVPALFALHFLPQAEEAEKPSYKKDKFD